MLHIHFFLSRFNTETMLAYDDADDDHHDDRFNSLQTAFIQSRFVIRINSNVEMLTIY